MDTIGIAMENFDGVGRHRTLDRGVTIDPVDFLFDGTEITSVADLRNWLVERPEIFASNTIEKLMQFALTRPLDWYYMPHVRNILRESAQENYKF